MKYRIIMLSVLLTACASSSQKVVLDPNISNGTQYKFIQDNTRLYRRELPYEYFARIEKDEFSPWPAHKFDSELSAVLDESQEAKAIKLKKFNLYFAWSKSRVDAVLRTQISYQYGAVGALITTSAAELSIAAARNAPVTEQESIGCEFLARYRGRIIDFYISEPACDDGADTCVPADHNIRKWPQEDPRIRDKVQNYTNVCIAKAIAKIKEFKELPILEESEQEIR